MATSSTADSEARVGAITDASGAFDAPQSNDGADSEESASVFDRLETAARAIWTTFLALVVVLALVPPVALWFGAVPFDAAPTGPYFALVGALFVGTAALIAAGIYDV